MNSSFHHDFAILLGDLNINFASDSTPLAILQNSFYTLNLHPLLFQPTFHRNSSHSTIDYICVSDPSSVYSQEQFNVPAISEHDALLATLAFKTPAFAAPTITRRSFKFFDQEKFDRDAANIDWGRVASLPLLDDKVQFLTTMVTQLFDIHAPLHTFTPRNRPSPWLTAEIRQLIRKRNKAWRAYKRNRNPTAHQEYKLLRNRVKTITRNAISAHYQCEFAKCKNSRALWRCVEELGLSKRAKENVKIPISLDSLNDFFVGTPSSEPLADKRPTVRISPDEQFYFKHVEVIDVAEVICRTSSNSCGPDGISTSFLKLCLPHIMPVLLNIFDCSLQSGVFPESWRSAVIRPIPKRQAATQVEHFRPISLLCSASKILETVALKQIVHFINERDILDPFQSGFRPHFSTHTALIKVVDDIREAIDHQEVVLMAAIDLTRAFDMVNISLLIDKLIAIGFSDTACRWIRSYLTKRSQTVVTADGERSQPLFRVSGVPQGSPSGPTFFSLFFNDAPSVIRNCKHHIYADDFTIYYSGSIHDVPDIVSKVDEDLNRIANWAIDNGLAVNSSKTKAIWFGTRAYINRLRDGNTPQVTSNGVNIEYCDSIKLLGVTLDSSLTWAEHVGEISRKSYAALARLRKCHGLIPQSTKLTLIKALVFPHLEYCLGVLLDLSQQLSSKLSRVKNAAIRFAVGLRKFEHITPVYKALELLPFEARQNFVCICLVASILRSGQPAYLAERLTFRPPESFGSKRCSDLDLIICRARTVTYLRSFCIEAAHCWNKLPAAIRSIYHKTDFKTVLYIYMLRQWKDE